ncbi:MAG: sulfatase, partial [Bacteroidota bacterium]
MTRLLALLLASAATVAVGQEAPSPEDSPYRPNVVWFVADDLSPILAAYGDDTADTPHLDRLAAEGVVYERAYVVTPVCAPSRTALVTGVHPTTMGALHMRTQRRTSALAEITDPELLAIPTYEAVPPPDVQPVSTLLQSAGYWTANRGKEDYQFATPEGMWHARGEAADWQTTASGAAASGGAASGRAPGQPFFYVHNDTETHESQTWERDDRPLAVDPEAVRVPAYYPDTPTVRRDLARQYTNLEDTDANLGRLLDALAAEGELDDTVVFVLGDHGDGLPRAKRDLYDSGLRVPLVVWMGAGVRQRLGGALPEAATRVATPVSAVDLAPTALALAGLDVPAFMHGRPLWGGPPRAYAFAAKGRMDPALNEARAVTDGRYKLILHLQPERPFVQFLPYRDRNATMRELRAMHAAGTLRGEPALWFRERKPEVELFDTHADPDEVRDLADDPAHAETRARLLGALAAWMDATRDPGALPEADLLARLWPGGEQPRTAPPALVVSDRGRLGLEISLSPRTPGSLIAFRLDNGGWEPYTGPFAVPVGTAV